MSDFLTETARRRSVLIADDEPETVFLLEHHLSSSGYDTHVARDGYQALTKAKVVVPDLILLDLTISGLRGAEVKNRLNQDRATFNIPVIFISDQASTDEKVIGFSVKADDVVAKPLNLTELLARIDALSKRYQEQERLLLTDALTGLGNLHAFKRSFSHAFSVARRYGRDFSIAVIDIDRFKRFNDDFGHALGDRVIESVARCLKKTFRETDVLIRYGGDEFVVLFPETGEAKAREGLQRLEANMKLLKIPVGDGREEHVTLSVGLASYSKELKRPLDLFELADHRMYEIKKSKTLPPPPIAASGSPSDPTISAKPTQKKTRARSAR